MNNEINDKFLNMYRVTYGQFINELRNKKIHFTNDKNYIQCWNTVLNTIIRNPKIYLQKLQKFFQREKLLVGFKIKWKVAQEL